MGETGSKKLPDDPNRLPLVSVVIPFYYDFETIGATLQSVFELDYPNEKLEILLVNDATDGGCDFLEKQPEVVESPVRIELFQLSTNQGIGGARNAGQKKARGPFLFFLDADDVILPKKLQIQLPPLLEDDSLDAVFSDLEEKRKGKIEKIDVGSRLPHFRDIQHYMLAWSEQISTFLFRKTALDAVGGHRRMPAEDKDLYFRMLLNGSSFQYCKGIVFQYRPRDYSYSSDEYRYLLKTVSRNFHLLAMRRLRREGKLEPLFADTLSRKLFLEARRWAFFGHFKRSFNRYAVSKKLNPKIWKNKQYSFIYRFLGVVPTEFLLFVGRSVRGIVRRGG